MTRTFTLRIDGKEYMIEQQHRALLVNGKRFEPQISGNVVTLGGLKQTVELNGERAFVDGIARAIETEGLTEHRGSALTPSEFGLDADGAINAIMPGLIIRVAASVGDEVKTGDIIVVLEAMKMENDICSPRDGVVSEIRVKAGESVQQNQVLAVIG
jgi:biotin carboxyl carrier protein